MERHRRHRRRSIPALAAAAVALSLLAACTSPSLEPASLGLGNPDAHAGTSPEQYPVHGIDLSKYQGDIDWNTVKRGNTAFAYLKATEGGDRVDSSFKSNWALAKGAGVPRGAYHFFYHCRSGASQADWFIRNVPRDPDALPPVLDVEWTPDSPTCTARPARADLVREMQAFLDRIEKYYGQRPILYVPIDVHRERLVGAFPTYEFWVRAVKDHPSAVYEGRPFRFWQWTATGRVPGVNGDVDRNAFAGSAEDFRRWLAARRPR